MNSTTHDAMTHMTLVPNISIACAREVDLVEDRSTRHMRHSVMHGPEHVSSILPRVLTGIHPTPRHLWFASYQEKGAHRNRWTAGFFRAGEFRPQHAFITLEGAMGFARRMNGWEIVA